MNETCFIQDILNVKLSESNMIGAKRKVNLSELAYEQIKKAICEGKIPSGDVISESQLAEELGMSRTPIREALRALASEGWVEIKNGIGTFVKPLSSKDMEDLYQVRCLLEVQAAKTSIYHITNEEIDDFICHFQKLLEECQMGCKPDPQRFSALDWKLHELIVERCQNNYIKTIMRSNTSNIKRYQFLSIETLNDIQESTRQHLNILMLMRNRDVEALSDALRQHLIWAAGFLKNNP